MSDESALMLADIVTDAQLFSPLRRGRACAAGRRRGRSRRGRWRARRLAILHLEELRIKNVTITTGLVDTSSTPMLLRILAAGRLDTRRFVTHRFGLDEMDEAYDVFAHPQGSNALKVALSRICACAGTTTVRCGRWPSRGAVV